LFVELLAVLLVVLLAELGVVLLAELGVALLAELGVVLLSGGLVDFGLADPVFGDPVSEVPDFVLSVLSELGFVVFWPVDLGLAELFDVELVVCEFDCVGFGSGFLVTLAGGS
jgi:hypothetical protein